MQEHPTNDVQTDSTPGRRPDGAAEPPNLELVLDIELPMWARFGQTEMTIASLSKIGPGTTIDLNRSPDDPVDLLVNDTVVARGEVVVASGHYGVRITEVVGRADRVRSLRAIES